MERKRHYRRVGSGRKREFGASAGNIIHKDKSKNPKENRKWKRNLVKCSRVDLPKSRGRAIIEG